MRAPAKLGRLHAFRQEAFDRPGVDEHFKRLRLPGALRIALGNMNAFETCLLGQPAPLLAGLGLLELEAEIARNIEQRLLDEPRHHARIGAAAGYGRGAAGRLAPRRQNGLAQRVVRALLRPELRVEIESGPRLNHGIDVEHTDLAAELHDIERRRIDREVDAKALAAAFDEQRLEQRAVVVARHRLVDEADAPLVQQLAILVLGVDDYEAGFVIVEMTLDQRQRAFADRPKADHDNGSADAGVNGPLGHYRASSQVEGLLECTQAARRTSFRAFTRRLAPWAAISLFRSGFGCASPVAPIIPRAPSSAPGCKASASNRSRSKRPGIHRSAVAAALKPNRS